MIEKFLENEKVDKDYKINKILTTYVNFINKNDFIYKKIYNSRLDNKVFYKNLYKKIIELDGKIPSIRCHGDLWDSNIIIRDNNFF